MLVIMQPTLKKAEALAPSEARPDASKELKVFPTPDAHSISELKKHYGVKPHRALKTLIVYGKTDDGGKRGLVALVLRGDHELNELKAQNHPLVHAPLEMAKEQDIITAIGAKPGSLGPVGLTIPIIVDRTANVMADFVAGANFPAWH